MCVLLTSKVVPGWSTSHMGPPFPEQLPSEPAEVASTVETSEVVGAPLSFPVGYRQGEGLPGIPGRGWRGGPATMEKSTWEGTQKALPNPMYIHGNAAPQICQPGLPGRVHHGGQSPRSWSTCAEPPWAWLLGNSCLRMFPSKLWPKKAGYLTPSSGHTSSVRTGAREPDWDSPFFSFFKIDL